MTKKQAQKIKEYRKTHRKKYYIDITAYLIIFLSSSSLVLISPIYLKLSENAINITLLLMITMNFIINSLTFYYVKKNS